MNTPSHAILNLAILGRYPHPEANLPIVIGAILPDIPIFVFYISAKLIYAIPEHEIWSKAYYQPFWQNIIATFHSIPLALIGVLISHYFGWRNIELLFISMVLHSILDLPVHSEDAHRHFYPFSDYRFISPISYWNPKKHGRIVSLVELLMVLGATFYVFSLIRSSIGKGLAIAYDLLFLISYIYSYLKSIYTAKI